MISLLFLPHQSDDYLLTMYLSLPSKKSWPNGAYALDMWPRMMHNHNESPWCLGNDGHEKHMPIWSLVGLACRMGRAHRGRVGTGVGGRLMVWGDVCSNIGQYPKVSKTKWLHVDIFHVFFIRATSHMSQGPRPLAFDGL